MRLDEADRARIGGAVTGAEKTTDAEIVTIVADRSDAYHDAVLHWAVLGLFLLIALQAAVPGHFVPLLDVLAGGWGRDWSLGLLLTALLILLVFVFLVLRYALSPFRIALAPQTTKARRVRRRAVLLFRTSIEARTATRSGVLLYVSMAERRAEIVTDEAVLAKVPAERWGETMAALIAAMRDGRPGDGMVAAVEGIGAILGRCVALYWHRPERTSRQGDRAVSETVWQGRYLAVEKQGSWEYAVRTRGIAAAVILAITDDRQLVLVEQFRMPIGRRCLEAAGWPRR